MRRIEDVKADYDSSRETDRKKIILIEWFQENPGKRFDRMELHRELGERMEVGQKRIGDYLNELADESVLDTHGEQRKSYQLADDILVPLRYQIAAGLRHLTTIFDFKRWGIVGVLVISSVLWGFLTLPFWFFSLVLFVSPSNNIGPISEYEVYVLASAMTLWLLLFVVSTYFLHRLRNWWQN